MNTEQTLTSTTAGGWISYLSAFGNLNDGRLWSLRGHIDFFISEPDVSLPTFLSVKLRGVTRHLFLIWYLSVFGDCDNCWQALEWLIFQDWELSESDSWDVKSKSLFSSCFFLSCFLKSSFPRKFIRLPSKTVKEESDTLLFFSLGKVYKSDSKASLLASFGLSPIVDAGEFVLDASNSGFNPCTWSGNSRHRTRKINCKSLLSPLRLFTVPFFARTGNFTSGFSDRFVSPTLETPSFNLGILVKNVSPSFSRRFWTGNGLFPVIAISLLTDLSILSVFPVSQSKRSLWLTEQETYYKMHRIRIVNPLYIMD